MFYNPVPDVYLYMQFPSVNIKNSRRNIDNCITQNIHSVNQVAHVNRCCFLLCCWATLMQHYKCRHNSFKPVPDYLMSLNESAVRYK